MRADDTLDWTTYLEELEQEAIRLRPHARAQPATPRASLRRLLDRVLAAAARLARTAVDSPQARG